MNQGNSAVLRVRVHLVLGALACTLVALAAIPAFASAALIPIEVDSLEDSAQQVPSATCDTGASAGENCTLRAAIEAADFDSGQSVIEFPEAIFMGGQEISPGTALPAITHPLRIVGTPVPYGGGYSGPPVGVRAPSGAAGLTVKSAGVRIEDMSFSGGKAGIEVLNESTGFIAKGDWFGLRVITTPAAISGPGILLGPGSDAATIGASEESGRNVFANATYGVYVEGASKAKILGNYIGVGPTGEVAAGLVVGVRIVDTAASPAEEDEVGGVRTSSAGTADCGGACNTIVASAEGVDLQGDGTKSLGSATGPTKIRGNYLGLAADGTELPVVSGSGIDLASPAGVGDAGPGDVTVGGSDPTEGNVIDGGDFAVFGEEAEGLVVQRNLVGWLPASGTSGPGPGNSALRIYQEGLGEPVQVLANEMHLGRNIDGVEIFGQGARIVANKIFGSFSGVSTFGEDGGDGSLVAENTVEGPVRYGVLLENDANTVTANTIIGAGLSGVITDREEAPEPFPAANRIGGDSPALENQISGSVESAISLGGEPETTNEVLGNFGAGNGGPFILLREHHTGHPPNEEIKPPVLEVVRQSTASGTAVPGAKVRLFGRPSTDPGSLERTIGSATADASGHWTATFTAKQAVGKLVAATQTSAPGTPLGATSEVSEPKAAEADPVVPDMPGQSTGGSSGSTPAPIAAPAPVKTKAPKVKITKGPKKTSTATKATFKFKAEPTAGASFECKLDGAKWAKCRSPKTYKGLESGKHTFRVRAKANGLTGPATVFKFAIQM